MECESNEWRTAEALSKKGLIILGVPRRDDGSFIAMLRLTPKQDKISQYFEKLRHDPNHHLGLGDIRLTVTQQEEIVGMV